MCWKIFLIIARIVMICTQYTTALGFRLLRQDGYRVSCDIFDKFKDEEGGFIKALKKEDPTAVLEFFEATHLRIHGEEVLDFAYIFTRKHLESILPSLSNPIAEQVHNALYGYSIRRGVPRVEARNYIPIYEQYTFHHQTLLKLAKLEFHLVQNLHKRELSELSRWWKGLEVPKKLPYARDRLVETYFWASGAYFEPKYSHARMMLIKLQGLISIVDDTFDAYGTFEELQSFANAIERWSYSCLDELKDECTKILYKALLEAFDDIEKQMIKQGTLYRLYYGKEAVKIIVRAYFDEVKWREEKYNPKTQEYLKVAIKSGGYLTLIVWSLLGMEENFATKEAFDWVLSQPKIVNASLTIARLSNDIVGYEFEQEREHIASAIELYTKEYKVSMEEVLSEFSNVMESGWKDVNEAFLRPTAVPAPVLYRILNYTRALEIIYNKLDRYTHVGTELQTYIKQLYIDPLP